jgi:hypothetical protein
VLHEGRIIQLVMKLLKDENAKVLKTSINILANMATAPKTHSVIKDYDGINVLLHLFVHSDDIDVRTDAADILLQLILGYFKSKK